MARIYRDGQLIEEHWQTIDTLEEGASLPAEGALMVSLELLLANVGFLENRSDQLIVKIEPDEDPHRLAPVLGNIAVVAVTFPTFADGRGFSIARILRDELGFKGEIRAVGAYILDQMPFLCRCGVTSFEISRPEILKGLQEGNWPEVTRYLQPAAEDEQNPGIGRSWVRRSARVSRHMVRAD